MNKRYIKIILLFALPIFVSLPATPSAFAAAPDFAPCCLSVAQISSTELNVSWVPVGSFTPALSGFRLERESPIGSGFVPVATLGSTVTTYADTNLSPAVTYNYRVIALNADGESSPSVPASGTTANPPIGIPPSMPQNLSVKAISGTEIDISWSATASSYPILGYRVERGTGISGNLTTLTQNSGSTVTTYADTGLSPNSTYNYVVTAINQYGPSHPTSAAYATTYGFPDIPRNISATAGDGKAYITWLPPAFQGGGLSGYILTKPDQTTVTLPVGATGTVVTGLSNGAYYSFGISAYNSAGTGPMAKTSDVMPQAAPKIPIVTTSTPPAQVVPTPATSTPAQQTVSSFKFTTYLQFGSGGVAVTELQKKLMTNGVYAGPITAFFGSLTRNAVRAYQIKNGISPTGTVGPLTRTKLNAN